MFDADELAASVGGVARGPQRAGVAQHRDCLRHEALRECRSFGYLAHRCAVVPGAVLEAGAGVLTQIRRLPDDRLLAKATIPAALLWVAGTGARMEFAVFAENGGAAAIARFSTANRITGAAAWTACLLLMALAEV